MYFILPPEIRQILKKEEKTMRVRSVSVILVFLTLALLTAFTAASAQEYKIGVLAKGGDIRVITQWSEHGKYLSKTVGGNFSIVPLNFTAVDDAVKEKKVDFFLVNPAIYVEMAEKYGAKALVTMINRIDGKGLYQFGGVLFTRKDSPIETLEDIKGKKFGFVKRNSFGGLHAALYTLVSQGIDPEKECALYEEMGTHQKVVEAVANGFLDVGTVRTDTLERMADEGKIKLEDFRILNQQENAVFPFVHSTILYPEWPVAALAHVDKKLAQQVTAALIALKEDSEAASTATIVGWREAVDYNPVRECLQTIGISAGE
jgi:two-component system, LuxR family, sensor histidine kinase TtrS